jgi:non-ribosomal peptide synthetase component F
MADEARYLYAVCRGLDPAALEGVPALGAGTLEVVEVLDVQAVVSTVDLDEFGEEGLRSNLERMEWVERVARGHDTVVQACARVALTAPMRLATICLDDRSVRVRLERTYDALASALARIEGRAEWSVKVYAHSPTTQSVEAAEPATMGGAAYLRRKKAAAEERRTAQADAVAAAEEVDNTLRAMSVAARRLRPQDPRLSGVEGAMVLNGAYLVDERVGRSFAERVALLAASHPGVSVSCAGPWPPYSFATLEEG